MIPVIRATDQFAIYLLKHRLISLRKVALVILWGLRYSIHLPHEQNVVRSYLTSGLDGLPMNEVRSIMRDFHTERLHQYYVQDALREIRRLQKQGIVCVLLSATFQGITEIAAEHCGFDASIGTKMQKGDDDRFIAEVDGKVIEGKEKLRALVTWADERYGSSGWELEYAFGDHYTDEPLLEAAQHPVAVNPSQVLRKKAKQQGWPIVCWE